MSSRAWQEGVNQAHSTIDSGLDRVARHDPTGVSGPFVSVGHTINDLSAHAARAQGEQAARFERETGMSVQQQVERGFGPASHMFASDLP